MHGGSCFFIRAGDSLFLVTAKHVLSGCSNSNADENFPTSMLLAVSQESVYPLLLVNIAPYRATKPCLPGWEEPDCVIVPISSPYAKNLRSVEHMLLPPFRKVIRTSIIGFPGIQNISEDTLKALRPTVLDFRQNEFQFVRAMGDTIRRLEDTINYCMETNIEGGSTLGGFSGSPFYVLDELSRRWRVAGILVGSRSSQNGKSPIYSVKIDYALAEIERILANQKH